MDNCHTLDGVEGRVELGESEYGDREVMAGVERKTVEYMECLEVGLDRYTNVGRTNEKQGNEVGETAFVSDNVRIRRSAGVIILLDLGVVLLLVAEVILMSGVMTVILVMVKEVRNVSGSSLLGKVTGSSGC